jgi:hypothetical protein
MKIFKNVSVSGIIIFSAMLVSCSSITSSIDRSSEITDAHFVIGKSKKTDIVNSIGLPDSVKINSSDGTESWFYKGRPIKSSYQMLPMVGRPDNIYSTEDTVPVAKDTVPVVLICVFDKNGILIESQNPRIGGK